MAQKLTKAYIDKHMEPNEKVYLEIGKKIDAAILNAAKLEIDKNGESEKITLHQTIEVTANEPEGCITVSATDDHGNTFTYHRQT